MPDSFAIDGVDIGPNEPVYTIAELSANHGGSLDRALETIRVAADRGASAVKIQTYRPGSLTLDLDRPPFVLGADSPWAGRRLYELYEEASTPWDWHPALFDEARTVGITLFSSPFDADAIELLESLDCPAYKIASFELVDLDLVGRAAATGKPLLMSTGMATDTEIDQAVRVATEAGAAGIGLLRCNSTYPAPTDEMDLRTVPDMIERWGVPVGLSDHTLTSTAAIVATALGASILEKHFCLDRAAGGPDAVFSVEPAELERLVSSVQDARRSVGSIRYGPSSAEVESVKLRRSLWVVGDVPAGTRLTTEHVRSLRPAGGLPPRELPQVLGRVVRRDLVAGTPLAWDLIE